MSKKDEQREIADKILEATEKRYGFVPLVNKVLSRRPDIFIPSANFTQSLLENEDQALERKTRFLCAVSAASAVGGEHCINVQMKHAKEAGASKDEILEAITIGSLMAMTKSQSYAFRKYEEIFGSE